MGFRYFFLILSIFIIVVTGCRFFSWDSDTDLSQIGTAPVQVFSATATDNADLEYASPDFSLKIPAKSVQAGSKLVISKYPGLVAANNLSNEFVVISEAHRISLDSEEKILNEPAKIGFSAPLNIDAASLFAAGGSDIYGWRIFSPETEKENGKTIFTTSSLSDWLLLKRIKTSDISPQKAPELTASPSTLFVNSNGYFSTDLWLGSSFLIASGANYSLNGPEIKLGIIAQQAFEVELSGANNFTRAVKSALKQNGINSVELYPANDPAFFFESQNNLASFSIGLNLKNKKPSDMPQKLLFRATLKDRSGSIYEKNLAVKLMNQPDQTLKQPLALEYSIPQSGDSKVNPNSAIELFFNRSLNKESFFKALTFEPAVNLDPDNFIWSSDNQKVQFKPENIFENNKSYKLSLGTNLKDSTGNNLEQPIIIIFQTTEGDPPEVLEFYPSPNQLLPTNGSLVFTMNEAIATDTFKIALVPATEYTISFYGLAVQVTPAEKWSGNTDYRVLLLKGLQDLNGNFTPKDLLFDFKTSDDIAPAILSFAPENGYTNASVTTSIKIRFDQAMNTELTEAAIGFDPIFPARNFIWNSTNDELTINFVNKLNYSTNYVLTIADSARSVSDKSLSQKYIYSFSTTQRPAIILSELIPRNNAIDVATNTSIIVPFNVSMNQVKVQQAFSLTNEHGHVINGSFSWNSNKLVFSPAQSLLTGILHKISISKAAEDANGNTLENDFEATFKTAYNQQTYLTSFSPASNSSNVNFNDKIVLSFSSPIEKNSFAVSIIPPLSGKIQTEWDPTGQIVTIYSYSGFSSNTTYIVSISGTTKDIFGQNIKTPPAFSFSSKTFNWPRLINTIPTQAAANVNPASQIVLEFDQAMNKDSVESAISILPAIGAKTYTWENSDSRLKIIPENPLAFSALYKLNLAGTAENSIGVKLAKSYDLQFTTAEQIEVMTTSPASAAAEVSTNSNIEVTFSGKIEQSSATGAFFVKENGNTVSGTISWNGNSMIFTPDTRFQPGAIITFGFSTQIKDLNGLAVKQIGYHSFSTVSASPPTITQTTPSDGQTQVPYNVEPEIVFSSKMATSSVSITISPGVANYNILWDSEAKKLKIKGLILAGNTSYQVSVDANSTNAAGIKLGGANSFSFTTAALNGPEIVSTSPISGSSNVPIASIVQFKFDRSIDPSTLNGVIAVSPETSFSTSVSDSDKTVNITFNTPLEFNTEYKVTLGTELLDSAGQALSQTYELSFTTESSPAVLSVLPANNADNIPVSQLIKLNFNKPMNTGSILSSFKLQKGLSTITGIFSFENADSTMVFQPAELLPGQTYNIILGAGAADKNGNPLDTIFGSTFATVPAPAFSMEFIEPAPGATQVASTQAVIASFSNPIDSSQISITYSPPPPSGYSLSLSSDKKTLTINPVSPLNSNQNYVLTINSSSKDIYGQALGTSKQISFTTAAETAPQIISSIPLPGSFDVSLNQSIQLNFNKPINHSSLESAFSISPAVAGGQVFSWSSDSTSVTVVFANSLSDNTYYQAKLLSTVADTGGLQLGYDYLLPFKTITRPTLLISELEPAPDSQNVAVQASVILNFNKNMNLLSVQNAFSMKNGSTMINGTFSQNGSSVTFTPSSILEYDTIYNLAISSLAQDTEGNYLKAPYFWSFKTSPEQGRIWQRDHADTTDSTHFSSRIDHALVELNNKLYLIGGYDGTYLNDVWQSTDGINWTKILAENTSGGTNQFSPRAGHACAVFNNMIYLTGGYAETDTGGIYYDDVWRTSDGITWTRVSASAEYYKRAYHNLAVYDNKLWIVAGETPDQDENLVLLDDCWISPDGAGWQQKSQIVSYFPRKKCATEVINGKLWIWGGYGKDAQGMTGPLNDGWYTVNGDVWLLGNSNLNFSPRCGMATAYFSDKVWLIGGSNSAESSGATFFNDVWITNDGIIWFQVLPDEGTTSTHFSRRTFMKASVLSNKLFITGGERTDGFTNEVWSTQ
ncbi:MAG: hypothetical protein Kow0029_16680 [Candidatus Rifleibacteriota bacterium]